MSQLIKYQTDSREGATLHKISESQGWVEYLNTIGQVYYFHSIDQKFYHSRRQNLIDQLPSYMEDTSNYIGWVHHLSQQRLVDNFILPIFGSIDPAAGTKIVQCGNSRLDACFLCGIPPSEIPMIAFSKSRMHLSAQAERLQSTQQFNNLFNLDKVDYKIVFEETDAQDVIFLNSILRYTVYDEADQLLPHRTLDTKCKKFWSKFQQPNSKYKIQIHSTAQSRCHIVDSDMFEIEHIEKNPSEWELSYGMMLGAFNECGRIDNCVPTLQLWLYDVTEPVNLELMIPWMSDQHNFYKTQNEKAVVIDGFHKSNGLQVIGNWVK